MATEGNTDFYADYTARVRTNNPLPIPPDWFTPISPAELLRFAGEYLTQADRVVVDGQDIHVLTFEDTDRQLGTVADEKASKLTGKVRIAAHSFEYAITAAIDFAADARANAKRAGKPDDV